MSSFGTFVAFFLIISLSKCLLNMAICIKHNFSYLLHHLHTSRMTILKSAKKIEWVTFWILNF